MAAALHLFLLAAACASSGIATVAAQNINPNDATTCATPIRSLYASHPECAQSCLGCNASNETFEHNCDVDSTCCGGPIAQAMIPLVYACVRAACPKAEDAQASWEEFLGNCARRGTVVEDGVTPGGYVYVKFEVPSPSKTVVTSPARTGYAKSLDPSGTGAGVVSPPPSATQTASSGNSGGKEGLSTADIIGVVLGSVSAVAAVMGVGWGRMRRARRPSGSKDSETEGEGSLK